MDPLFRQLREVIASTASFVLVTHMNADGDGLGAQFALARFLRRHGKTVRVINTDPIPHQYRFLIRDDAPELYDAVAHAPVIASAGAIVILDNSSANRLSVMRDPVKASPAPKICIDHHPTPDTQWDLMVIDETACATGEIVYRLIRDFDGDVDPAEAIPIYVSVVTDTGNFRFSNTTPRVLAMASDLVSKGVSVPTVYQEVFERNTPSFVRLLGTALASIRQDETGRLGYIVMSRAMMQQCGADGEDTSDIINGILTIGGTRMAILFKELLDGRTKVSLRSKGSIDVNRLASEFGGGGHRNASGAVLGMGLDQAVDQILPKARALVV
jgi:phosphoesterase RecJ-like protein